MPTDSTIKDYRHATKPTTVDEIDGASPETVTERISTLSSWEARVSLNGQGPYTVGRTLDDHSRGYYLYHRPEDPDDCGLAGRLINKGAIRSPDDEKVIFDPAGDDPDETTVVKLVESLTIRENRLSSLLEDVLPDLRTAITESDWRESERADTTVDEWGLAAQTLAEFHSTEIDDDRVALRRQFYLRNEPKFALARYPLSSTEVADMASMAIERTDDLDRYTTSPEAFRQVLVDYATTVPDIREHYGDLEPTLIDE